MSLGDQCRAKLPEGVSTSSGTFLEHTSPLTELPRGSNAASTDKSSRPSMRVRLRHFCRHPVWVWVGDFIGALSLFATGYILLWIAEILK
jgi:hypothetical protein